MRVESRTKHYWVDVETGEGFDTRLDAEVHALHRELCEAMCASVPKESTLMYDVARYICGNYELHSLRDEDYPNKSSDEGPAG